jgi:predicted lipid-binding transport protein (Tim44 family)
VKRIVLSVFIGLIGLGFVAQDADARRLGGGMSQGMKRQVAPPRQQPTTPPQQATPQQPAATPAMGGAAAAAPAAAPKRSWLGPVAGLAAGLGIAALMSHFGMGDTLANIVMLALLVLVAVVAVRFLMRRFIPQPASSNMQYAGAGAHGAAFDAPARDMGWATPPAGSSSSSSSTALQPQALPAGSAASHAVLPPGFNQAEFERAAKMIFIRMQAANDAADLEDLRQFSTPEMFAAFRVDLQDRHGSKQRTDVVRLDADMADWAEEDGKQIVSVRFSGLIREEEGGVAQPFDEIWHLVRPADASRQWAIAGIQQVEMAQKH